MFILFSGFEILHHLGISLDEGRSNRSAEGDSLLIVVAEQVGTVEEDHAVVIVRHDISAGIVSLAEHVELNILARIVADDAVERRIAEVLAAVSVLGKAGAFSVDKLGRYFAGQKSQF